MSVSDFFFRIRYVRPDPTPKAKADTQSGSWGATRMLKDLYFCGFEFGKQNGTFLKIPPKNVLKT
jgi:hypothetical protein